VSRAIRSVILAIWLAIWLVICPVPGAAAQPWGTGGRGRSRREHDSQHSAAKWRAALSQAIANLY